MSARKYQEVQDMQPEPVRFVAESEDVETWKDAGLFWACVVIFLSGWAFVGYIFWRSV